MKIVARTASVLQSVLTTMADEVARQCGVIQRERKFRGSSLAQTFALGWLRNPQASVEELAQQAAVSGASVSPQAIQQRFTKRLAMFFQVLLERAVGQMIAAEAKAIPLLQKFPGGVWISDSTIINLPPDCAEDWPACGGNQGTSSAAVKVQFCFDYLTGCLRTCLLRAGRSADSCPDQLPAGALRLADLGYFQLSALAECARAGAWFITRIQPHTAVYSAAGKPLPNLCRWLKKQRQSIVDLSVLLGMRERLSCRLVAVRAPAAVVRKRRARLKKEAYRRCRAISAQQWEWTRWTILATNIPPEMATWQEIGVLYRLRWQIELLFKLWKSHGEIDESRSKKPERILTEVFAKLLGTIVQHWLLLTTVWQHADVSLTKAARMLRSYIPTIGLALSNRNWLRKVLVKLRDTLEHLCRINPRRKQPNTYQLLLAPEQLDWGLT